MTRVHFIRRRARGDALEAPGADRRACVAPWSALYFQPDGVIKACCTTQFAIGQYHPDSGRSLHDEWQSLRLAQQRDALDSGDFGLGCHECGALVERGYRSEALAATFDRYSTDSSDFPRMIDFALSNACNLQCVMCNGELSSAIRSQREHRKPLPKVYDDAFFEQLREFLPHLRRAQFKGGEPFLSPETSRVWDMLLDMGLRPEVSVTTNGTVWNPRVERYVRELRMHPIVSVDAMSADVLESTRVGVRADELWANVDRFQTVSTETGAGMTLSFCLMTTTWRELHQFLAEVERRDCGGNVVIVNQPVKYSLVDLPTDELAEIVSALEQDERDGSLKSVAARALWSAQVDTLRSQLDAPATDESRFVNDFIYTSVRAADESSIMSELRGWSGQDVALLHLVGGRIAEVSVPDHARWLIDDSWRGLTPNGVPDKFAELGIDIAVEPADRPDGLPEHVITATTGGTRQIIRVVVLPPTFWDRPTRQQICLALRPAL